MIFFHDKHWYRSEPLFSVEEEDEEDEEDEEKHHAPSPTLSQATITSVPPSSQARKPEYEFLLFNYLLRFVHREGQIGDFARAGLLFLMDVAMSPTEPNHVPTSDTADPVNDAALALAEYILDGDFSEVLGAGLGAVYSLLPSKIEFYAITDDASKTSGMSIGSVGPEDEDEKEMLEVTKARSRAMGVQDANDPDLKAQLDHFLKLLEFIHDVLRRNIIDDANSEASSAVGSAIVASILDSVRRIFLENVLYPSILECSDLDGSAVAVMSYIEIMIRGLHAGQLNDLLVDFLITEDNDDEHTARHTHSKLLNLNDNAPPKVDRDKKAKHRRRKSSAMTLLEMEAPDAKKPSEYITSMGRFTLKDLLLTNMRSTSQATATSALQLLQTVMVQHPEESISKILLVIPDQFATSFPQPFRLPSAPTPLIEEHEDEDSDLFDFEGPPAFESAFVQPEVTYSTHEREMGLYLTLISRVDPSHSADAFSTGYEHYLRDALVSIQSQEAYQMAEEKDVEIHKRMKHKLNVNDPILTNLLDSLRKFFSNTPELNIALTGIVATMAMHPDRSLAGWLTFGTSDEPSQPSSALDSSPPDADGDDRSIDFRIEERLSAEHMPLPASRLDEQSRPLVHTIYHGLVAQLERYRQVMDDFDQFLLERRQGLLFSENLNDALSLAFEAGSINPEKLVVPPTTPPKPKPQPSSNLSSSLKSFLTPRKNKTKTTEAPSTPPKRSVDELSGHNMTASPFAPHYQRTVSITVEPFAASAPATSTMWSASQGWSADDDDVFGSSWSGGRTKPTQPEAPPEKPASITLSHLLDNVVILEESIKELAAIIHARRSLGIDSIRYI